LVATVVTIDAHEGIAIEDAVASGDDDGIIGAMLRR